MKARFLALLLLAPAALRAVPLPPLAPVPGNAAEPQRTALAQRRSSLQAELDGLRAAVAHYNAETAEQQTQAESQSIFQHRTAYLAKAEAFNREVAAATPPTPPPSPELAKVKAQIAALQEVLRQLQRSAALDATVRAEWVKRSQHATLDAYKTTAKLGMEALGHKIELDKEAAQEELGSATDLLAGTTDPARRDQLHSAFGALVARRDELVSGSTMYKISQTGVENALDSAIPDEEPPGEIQKYLEAGWSIAEKLHVMPPGAVLAKSTTDYAYDSLTQLYAWRRTQDLNANSDKYLQAVAGLQNRMKALVAQEKQLGP